MLNSRYQLLKQLHREAGGGVLYICALLSLDLIEGREIDDEITGNVIIKRKLKKTASL